MKNLRSDFYLDPEVIFLNHGSFGATPRPVFECYQSWQLELERQPVEFLGRRFTGLMQAAREALATYLGTQADNLVYISNATQGVNIAARSLALRPGDEVLSTDHEYGALDRTWRFLSRKQGFHYINLPIDLPIVDETGFVEHLWQGVTPQTRVIYLSHITSPTAIIFPVVEICRRARQAGILTIIDGAHAPGQVDLNLDELGADIYTGNLHKWLCAPKGAGFFYARPEVQPLIEPLTVSWGWEAEKPSSSRFIDEQEWTGTRDIAAFLAVPEAIRYQQEHHWEVVRQECHALASQALRRIGELTGLPANHPDSQVWFAQMGAALLPTGIEPDSLKTRLYDEYRVEIPITRWRDRSLIRFSFQAYNRPSDLEALISALQALL